MGNCSSFARCLCILPATHMGPSPPMLPPGRPPSTPALLPSPSSPPAPPAPPHLPPLPCSSNTTIDNIPYHIDILDGVRDGVRSVSQATLDASARARIYVLDSGIYAHSADFCGRVAPGFSAGCRDNGNDCPRGWWPQGIIPEGLATRRPSYCSIAYDHGTHVASTAAGTRFGIAPLAKIVAVQVLDCSGSGSTAQVVRGIEWAARDAAAHPDERAVITMSLNMFRAPPPQSMVDAVRLAYDNDVSASQWVALPRSQAIDT